MKCYFCGQPNGCELGEKTTCWCEQVHIPNTLLEKIPENERGKSCICRKCVEKSHNSG